MKYLIGTRGSRLSLAQTRWVIGMLKDANPDCDYEIVTITTRGDTDSRPLFAIDQRGIFEKDVDRAVSDGRVHFAVHSMKGRAVGGCRRDWFWHRFQKGRRSMTC